MKNVMLTGNIVAFLHHFPSETPQLNSWCEMPFKERRRIIKLLCLGIIFAQTIK